MENKKPTIVLDLEIVSCGRCGATLWLPREEALNLEKRNCDCPYCSGELVYYGDDEND